jgi:hypothetical protein
VLPHQYENTGTTYTASFKSPDGQHLAKHFMMACMGYGKSQSEEKRFHRDQAAKDWSFKPADGTVGNVWTQLVGARVIAVLDYQPNQNEEMPQFTSWRSVSSGPFSIVNDLSTDLTTSQPVLVEREASDAQVSQMGSQAQAINAHTYRSSGNLILRRIWLICKFSFLIPACFVLFFSMAFVSFDYTRHRSTIGGLIVVAAGLFLSILLPGAIKESWDELTDISREDTARVLEGRVNWGPPSVATILVILSVVSWPSAFYSILRAS